MSLKLMDCTLRDGGNVVGDGFDAVIEDMVIDGLTAAGTDFIEFGHSKGIGAYDLGYKNALTDDEYFDIAAKYMDRGSKLGMFLNAKRYTEANVQKAKERGVYFLRVGAEAGDAAISLPVVEAVKRNGLHAFYSLMKAYLLSPEELAEEAKKLEAAGLDEITIMDSAGTMLPDEVERYTTALKEAVSIPVGFHCHNNLLLSCANAVAAYKNGADILDCGLMGMAPDDERVPDSYAEARRRGLLFSFAFGEMPQGHPNTARLVLRGVKGADADIEAVSVGGGRIEIRRIGDMALCFSAEQPTLIIRNEDKPGTVADVSRVLSEEKINIATFQVNRNSRGGTAVMVIECDTPLNDTLLARIRSLPGILRAVYINRE